MKIDTKILVNYLTKIRMGEVDTCLLQFNDLGLEVNVMATALSHNATGILNASAFKEYQPIGNVGVDSLGKLITVFKRLGKELEFSVKGNLLTAAGAKKEVSFELVDEKYIGEPNPTPNLAHSTICNIPAKVINDFFADASTNKDCIIQFETVANGLKLTNTGKYKFTHNIDSEGTKAGEIVKFGKPLLNALSAIDEGDLIIHLKTDYPILVVETTAHHKVTYMVAPHVDSQ